MDLLQVKNFAFSTLASGILINGSSITLASGHSSRFPVTGSFIAVIWGASSASPAQDSSRELVNMTFVSGDTYTVTRAVEGTSAKAWDAGSNIACVITAGKLNELEFAAQNGLLGYAAATGTNTYTSVLNPIPASYVQGARYHIRFNNASTGPCTLALNSLAGKKLYSIVNGSYVAATSGHIISGMVSEVFYDSSLDGGGGGFILSNSTSPIYAYYATTAGACTGNAATATKLATAVNIGGVSFDGSVDITLPGVNTAGNQNTSGNAATATTAAACSGNAATATTATNALSLGGLLASTYAKLSSPAFTGSPTAPTPGDSSDSTAIATTAFVKNTTVSNDVGYNSVGSICLVAAKTSARSRGDHISGDNLRTVSLNTNTGNDLTDIDVDSTLGGSWTIMSSLIDAPSIYQIFVAQRYA